MRIRSLLVVASLAFAFALIFWPGLYRYDVLKMGDNSIPVRTNRLTGQGEMFDGGAWHGDPPEGEQPSTNLPSGELRKLSGKAYLHGSSFYAEVYNGSEWTVTEIEYRIRALNPPRGNPAHVRPNYSDSLVRTFPDSKVFRDGEIIAPLSNADVSFTVGSLPEDALPEWSIVAARGHPPTR